MNMIDQNKKVYAHEAKQYASEDYWRADEQHIAEWYFKSGSMLILGCGAGRVVRPIVDMGFSVTAIDIVPEMVVLAQEKLKDTQAQVSQMDAADLSFGNEIFDTIFFPFHGIDYVDPDIYAAVGEAHRVMKKDGVFIFSSHNRLYLKKLHRFFSGTHDDYHGLHTYRTSPVDVYKLKKFFKSVKVVHRISLLDKPNWKDRLYQLLPWFSKSTYFVCKTPKKI